MPRVRTAVPVGFVAHPARLVFCYVPNGVDIARWVPGGNGPGSPAIDVLQKHFEDLTVLSGLGHPAARGGHSGADTWLTGADLEGSPGFDYRNSISVDQVAAETLSQSTRVRSLELGSRGGTGQPGHSQTLAFDRDGTPQPAEASPSAVFERMFVDSASTIAERRVEIERRRGTIRALLDQAEAMADGYAGQDAVKLEQYRRSVVAMMDRLERELQWLDVPKPKLDPADFDLKARPNEGNRRARYFDTMFDVIAQGLRTDSTRVVTFQLGREAGGGHYAELGLNADHHQLSHHGGDRDMLDGLHAIDRFLLQRLDRFLTTLRQAEVLDSTIVVWGSGMNSGAGGGHSPKNLPLLIAGGRGLGLRHGRHLAFEPDSRPLNDVWLTCLQACGVDVEAFGDSTGPISELRR